MPERALTASNTPRRTWTRQRHIPGTCRTNPNTTTYPLDLSPGETFDDDLEHGAGAALTTPSLCVVFPALGKSNGNNSERAQLLHSRHQAFVEAQVERLRSQSRGNGSADAEMPQRPGAAVGEPVAAPEIEYLPWGETDSAAQKADRGGDSADQPAPAEPIAVVGTFGWPELEYAALRNNAGLLDKPQRGTLIITGDDRIDFLNRMVTQELKHLEAGRAAQSFWLNRKGRIDADLLITELGDRIVIDLDIHHAAAAAQSLSDYIFTEDVNIKDRSDAFYHLGLHGPRALEMLRLAADEGTVFDLQNLQSRPLTFGGATVVAIRRDQIGGPGVELIAPIDDVGLVWDRLVNVRNEGLTSDTAIPQAAVRPVGWYAFNMARIEAGTPLFNVDFGTDTLPHETGILYDRVSFTKGCYLGQEIVARMESRGRPKQMLVSLMMIDDAMPVTGSQVFEPPADNEQGQFGDVSGVVTSSTPSPLIGAQPVAIAMVRTKAYEPGKTVVVEAEGQFARGRLQTLGPIEPLREPAESGEDSNDSAPR